MGSRMGKTDCIHREMWSVAHCICAPASKGAHAVRNSSVEARVEAGCGGVALGIHTDLVPFLVTEGVVNCLRAVWACLDHPTWGKIGFVAVYDPNESVIRSLLWDKLAAALNIDFKRLLPGDFNMIESPTDHIGGDGQIIRGREARAWKNLARKLNLTDTFIHKVVRQLCFSWDNQRLHRHNPANADGLQNGSRIFRRIDRIYAPRQTRSFSIIVSPTTLPGFALSDHAPVVGLLKCGGPTCRPTRHRMSTAHLCTKLRVSYAANLAARNGGRCVKGVGPGPHIADRCLIDIYPSDGQMLGEEKGKRKGAAKRSYSSKGQAGSNCIRGTTRPFAKPN